MVFGACGGQRTNLNLFTHQCAGFLTGSAAGTHGWLGFSLVKTKRRASGDRRNSAMIYTMLCALLDDARKAVHFYVHIYPPA